MFSLIFKKKALKFYCLLLTVFVIKVTTAQMVREPVSLKYIGLGVYSKNFADVYSGTSNQASLAQLPAGSFGVYGERRFMQAELNNYSAIIAVPTASGVIGVQGDYFGSNLFNENQIGLIYARKITSVIDIGAKFNYHSVRVAGYGTSSAINFEIGSVLHLTDKLHSGFHIYNPTSSKLSKSGNEKLAAIYRFGLGYEASKNVFISTEIVKQENKDINVNAGLQYNLHEKIILRTGISTLSNNSFVGLGLKLNFGRIDINAAYHPQLGFTPGMLLIINFKKS